MTIGYLEFSPQSLADGTPQTLPFSQNWANTSMITTNDNWSGVAGIEGYLGQDITTTTGTDPQTLLGTSAVANDLTVLANQTATNITNGDVAEFHITSQGGAPGSDPTIALQGSGTADAPYILLYLNTTGQSNINISYNLRDIDCTADVAVQQVALQYRLGNTGNFTNIPAGYVADATGGPSVCTQVTPVSVGLPAAADNQNLVQVRIISSNAIGNDEWVGVDDISVTTGGGGGQPTLNIGDVTLAEGNSGTTTFTFTISLTGPAPSDVTFSVATQDGTAQDDNPASEDNDYVAKSEPARTITTGNNSATFTVDVNGDATPEANEGFFVNVTGILGANAGDTQAVGTITNDDFTSATINQIQGAFAASPLAGQTVITSGIVTLLKTGTNNGGPANGFFLQTPEVNADADPNTSEGIFVFTSTVPSVSVGDAVTVTGTIDEFFNLTEITSVVNIAINSTGNALPAPVPLDPSLLDPAAGPTQPQLERFEGMRMSAQSLVSVAPNDNFFDVFTVLGGVPRPFREPGIAASLSVPPDPTSGVPDANVPRWDENPERLVLDTNGRAGSSSLPYTSNVTFSNVVGALDFTFNEYRLVPESALTASPNMTAVPVPTPLATEFTVANFNIENFANDGIQRLKASLAIRNVLRYPDIIGHEEIFDLTSLQALAGQVNADAVAAGDPNPLYLALLIPAATGTQHVGFLVKTARVQIISVTQERASETYINPLSGSAETLHDRPPLVLRAVVDPLGPNPANVIAVVNHTRSFIDIEADPPPADGVRVRAKRKAQGESIAGLFQELQTNNPSTSIIAVGDYNAFQFNDGYTDPIATMKGIPTPDDQVVVDQSPDLVDPDFVNLTDFAPATEQYSFVFEGTPQALDHILLNRFAFVRFTRYAVARFDADFPTAPAFTFATNPTRPEAVSDHDSPVAYFNLTVAPSAANGIVSGRITTAIGSPVAGAVIKLEGAQTRKTITDADGQYRFEQVDTNGFYTVTPLRANFDFSPQSRSFNQFAQRTEASFTAAALPETANPIDTPEYFVRQQYVDLLGREPDEGGFNYWSEQIIGCGVDVGCLNTRRVEVAAAFFIEAEFQRTGSFLYGLYKGGLGRQPVYQEFSVDRAQLVEAPNLETVKQAFAESFVQRPEFLTKYQAETTADSFVGALLRTVQQASGLDLSNRHSEFVSRYNAGSSLIESRGLVVRALSENADFRQSEYNQGFVLTEYFGYLRRDPEPAGYAFWLDVLNNRVSGNYRSMVCAFITSAEYQRRFSSLVTRSNSDCGP
jgi:predicted extracellular nuclease